MSFLLFACPKSGTTWLQRLLSHHPGAVCAESRAFGDYFAPGPASRAPHLTLEKYVAVLGQYFAPAVDGLAPGDDFYRTLLFNFIDTLAASTRAAVKKAVYGEKFTPYRGTAENALAALREYHPGVKFVNLTRDGRDVIVSGAVQWLNLRLREAAPEQRAALETALRDRAIPAAEFEMFLRYWEESSRAGLKARELFRNYLRISYEDFVASPISQAGRLFEFLGIDAGAGVVGDCVRAASFETLSGGRRRGEEDNASFFRKGVVGDWKNWLSAEQQAVFSSRAGALLKELGY